MAAAQPEDLDLIVPVAPTAAREARRAIARSGLVTDGQEATLLLLVSELVSNSVRHAGLREHERIRLRARWREESAYVEVCDAGRSGRVPAQRPYGAGALDPGGLGLVLVDEMADRWGVDCNYGETCVWFELACDAA
jgi:anti-sigma regulatory factor (Ser/Thr protein kinase)